MIEKLTINDNEFLERLSLSHVDLIFNAIDSNRQFLRKWLPFVDFTRKVNDTERFVQSILEKPVTKRDEVYVVWYKHEFAGLIGFKDPDRINDKIEIGYWLIEKMTGKGIATAAVRKMVNLAFRNMEMNRVQIRCGVGNDKSSAIPRRLGFTYEGIERAGERHNHLYIDLEVYSLLKKEWAETLF
ncbi:MAG: GNAT family N-acetyltransferase [Methylococcaceae bacterium]|nr:GNAT family protein [Prolixibacteraceae bacterium]